MPSDCHWGARGHYQRPQWYNSSQYGVFHYGLLNDSHLSSFNNLHTDWQQIYLILMELSVTENFAYILIFAPVPNQYPLYMYIYKWQVYLCVLNRSTSQYIIKYRQMFKLKYWVCIYLLYNSWSHNVLLCVTINYNIDQCIIGSGRCRPPSIYHTYTCIYVVFQGHFTTYDLDPHQSRFWR